MKLLKALSLQQPWADVVLKHGKMVENRKWKTNYRGFFLIHASKTYDKEGEAFILSVLPDIDLDSLRNAPRGYLVGAADLTDCVHKSFWPLIEKGSEPSPWAFGPWCFALDWVKSFNDPVPCRGMLNFFTPPLEAYEALQRSSLRHFESQMDIGLQIELGDTIQNLK